MKRIILITVSLTLCLALAAPSAWAGRRHFGGKYRGGHHYRHRHDIGKFAVGLGAAIVGGAIIHGIFNHHRTVYRDTYRETYAPPPSNGHWETRRVWVQPSYKRMWEPGHYDYNGNWIPGHWIRVTDQAGYWTEQRVWVAYR